MRFQIVKYLYTLLNALSAISHAVHPIWRLASHDTPTKSKITFSFFQSLNNKSAYLTPARDPNPELLNLTDVHSLVDGRHSTISYFKLRIDPTVAAWQPPFVLS
jgi:hypothetical protein